MDKIQIREQVMQVLIEEELISGVEAGYDIKEDSDLEAYGMDSYAFVHMIVKLEQKFGIEMPTDYLQFEKWETIAQVVKNVCEITGN